MENDYGWLKQLMMRGMYQPTNRSMPGMLAQVPIGGGANPMDAAMAQKLAAPLMKSNPMAVWQPQQQGNLNQPQPQSAPASAWTGDQQS